MVKKPMELKYRVTTSQIWKRVRAEIYRMHEHELMGKKFEDEIQYDAKDFRTGYFGNYDKEVRDLCEQAEKWCNDTIALAVNYSGEGEYSK